uniref:NADH dehydrogenase subunit 1 n=1 Tax=Stigmaeopsis continentalis TaxID=2547534 RepID=UPI002869F9BA|nr:NADH dehydrogenase subunit 1 [Stigmaeopsis continentalis]WKW93603.1 NADH dehydrogenase subunit 1 [Stigmaeopsis continentalis]
MLIMEMMIILMILLSVMFVTLLERKFLGVLNYRKGPNNLFMNSFLQSLTDFIKLMTKKMLKMNFIMKYYWVLMIFFGVLMLIILAINYPFYNSNMYMYTNFLMVFSLYSLMAYFFLLLSYSSNSIFSMMSLYRVLIQILSYEVGLIFLFLIPLTMLNTYNFYFYMMKSNFSLTISIMLMYSLILVSLSEMNRTPFEFLESETELVSGFNVEYMASLFSFIFLIEYGFFMMMMILLNFFFLMNMYMLMMMYMIFIWTRSFLPRYRYDKMLYLFWKDLIMLIFSM